MDWPTCVGYILLVAVPAVIWLIVGLSAKRMWKKWSFFAIIAGSDNRLSLSRLQAFVWTLIVFGAYAAATAVTDIGTGEEWIKIPDAILALTGISLASGVISSVIASVTDEHKRCTIEELSVDATVTPKLLIIKGFDFDGEGTVRIGRRQLKCKWFDHSAERETSPAIMDEIHAQLPSALPSGPLIVDTANGKVAHKLEGTLPDLKLGEEKTAYEWIDLFRNDKSPRGLDLMKFQMFGWTLVAATLYVVVFVMRLHDFGNTIKELPNIDETIVILTGISQAAYNAAKGTAAINTES